VRISVGEGFCDPSLVHFDTIRACETDRRTDVPTIASTVLAQFAMPTHCKNEAAESKVS